ncbi:MAG TPA: ABC transporter substrate-binding protein [Acidimicrobiales bacterium]
MTTKHRPSPFITPTAISTVLVATALCLAGCGSAGKGSAAPGGGGGSFPTSHTLTLSFLQDPGQPPDPAVYYAGEGIILQDNMYDGLVQYAGGTAARRIIPDLATSWTVSSDSTTYTFQLRPGVTFHDGTAFDSSAVAPSFARDSAVNGGPAYMAQAQASITPEGPSVVVIKLNAPNTSFLDYLASAYGPRIYSPTGLAAHAGSDHDQAYLTTHDLGTGPYTLTKAQVGVDYQLSAYPGYWGSKPYYTTVDLPVIDNINTEELEFQHGQIAAILHDLTSQAISSYAHDKAVVEYRLPTLTVELGYLNPTSSFLTTPANRVALLEAINQKQIVADVYSGHGTLGSTAYPADLLPPGMGIQNYPYDPSALRRLVAGLPSSQRSFTIGYDTGSPDDQLIASLMTDQLDAAGLSVKSVGYQTSTIYGWAPPGNPSGAPDLLVEYGWPDAYDPYQWAHIDFDPNGGINFLHCTVPNSSDQLSQAVAAGNTTLFGQVGDEAVKTGCYMNIANRNDVFVAQPWLKGIVAAHVAAYPYSLTLADLYPG